MTKIEMFVVMAALGAAFFPALGSGRQWVLAIAQAQSGESQFLCEPASFENAEARLPFNPSNRLVITLPGSVRYRPGDKAEAVIRGDAAIVNQVRLEDGKLRLACEIRGVSSRLEIDLTGPAIADWQLTSSANLTLRDISQPELLVNITGSGNVIAEGTVDAIGLRISGSGNFKGKSLTSKSAKIEIRGSGDAQVTAKVDADVSIYGSGNVKLFGNPNLRHSKVAGSGRISQVP